MSEKNFFKTLGVFLFSALFGVMLAIRSWNGVIYVSKQHLINPSDGRIPATSVHRSHDLSALTGDPLARESKRILVTDARVNLEAGSGLISLQLGHFVMRDSEGMRRLACQYFNRLILHFEGDGIAEEGRVPTMDIEAPCMPGEDLNRMAPILIPYKTILVQAPVNMDLQFPELQDQVFVFEGMPSDWPLIWNLKSVRLFHETQLDRDITVSRRDLSDLRETPLRLEWK